MKWVGLLAICFLSACEPMHVGEPQPNFPEQTRPAIDEAVISAMIDQTIPGLALGIVEDGEITYLQGYGWSDLVEDKLIDPRVSSFRWASVSKTITGTAAVQAESEGELDLDESI